MRYHQTKVGNVYVTDPTTGVPHDCHPVAVIPFEDREQVERFVRACPDDWAFMQDADTVREVVAHMQAALREFVAPTQPKPDEPQGLGAVVEDEDGSLLVRIDDGRKPWTCHGSPRWSWAEIAAVRVLSEGVVA